MTPIYNSTIPKQYSIYTVTIAYNPARPAKQPLPREIRTSHQVYPLNCSEISTLLFTCRRSNDFCVPPRNTARPIYFYAVIYIIRTSTVICSDDTHIYIYIYAVISTSSERHGTAICGAARTCEDNDRQQYFRFFVLFFCFFLFTVVCEQGLK